MKYLCASFLILISGMMSAQNSIVLEASYSLDMSESAKLTGNAMVEFQDNAFHMIGDGFEIYCDGSDIWTLDFEAKEVYVEVLDADYEEYMKEAALKLSGLEDNSEADFTTPDGQEIRIKVVSIKKSDRKDISSFLPNQNFDSSWVIVDLR